MKGNISDYVARLNQLRKFYYELQLKKIDYELELIKVNKDKIIYPEKPFGKIVSLLNEKIDELIDGILRIENEIEKLSKDEQ